MWIMDRAPVHPQSKQIGIPANLVELGRAKLSRIATPDDVMQEIRKSVAAHEMVASPSVATGSRILFGDFYQDNPDGMPCIR
jgi:hypothetical protein